MVYDEIERARERIEARLIPAVADIFASQGDDLIRLVRQGDVDYAERMAADEALAFEVLALVWGAAVPPFARATYEGLEQDGTKAAPSAGSWLQRAIAFLNTQGGVMVRAIASTVLDDLRAVLSAGVRDGLGVDALARRLSEVWPEITRRRAERIVRTEVVSASNAAATWGAERVADDTGLVLDKEWIATRDGRTRESHRFLDRQRVPMGGTFNVGGYEALHPGDVALPPSERVNCRCAIAHIPREVKTARGRSWRIERDEAIKAAYPALREEHGAEVAKTLLAEEHAVSERTVERAVYGS